MSIKVLRTDFPSWFPDPAARKSSKPDVPAINSNVSRHAYFEDDIAYEKPDFGAIEYSQIIND